METVCKNFEILEGCGECKIYLTEKHKLKYLSPISMSDIVNVLFECCIKNGDKMIILKYSTIACDGNMEIVYGNDEEGDYINYNKKICKEFVSSWYYYHKVVFYEAISLIYMARVVGILNMIGSDSELISEATKLTDVLNELMK